MSERPKVRRPRRVDAPEPELEREQERHSKAAPEIASEPDFPATSPPAREVPRASAAAFALPAGEPKTAPPWGGRFGVPWADARPLLPAFLRAAAEFGLPPELPIAVGLVESTWRQFDARGRIVEGPDRYGGCTAKGVMQVKDCYWGNAVPGADWREAEGNIRIGCKLLRTWTDETGSWQGAIRKYHPGTSPNGTTPESYVRCVAGLMAEIAAANTTPAPEPPKPADPLSAILGGGPVPAVTYGFKAPAAGPWYAYFEGHGGSANQHTGVDVSTPYGTTYYAPIAGTIVCAGTDRGPGAWGTGCSAFRDTGDADPARGASVGVGRVELLSEDGKTSIIFGHARKCLVPNGAKVKPGDPICTSGGANGAHIHLEVRVWREDGRCSR